MRAGLVTIGLFSVAAAAYIFLPRTPDIAAVCGLEPRPGFTECVRESVGRILDSHGAADVMAMLERDIPAASCHVIGHIVGEETYMRAPSLEAALAACTPACTSACIHGAAGAALAGAVGEASVDALRHPTLDMVRSYGKDLCSTREACHAVGHILLQQLQSVPEALVECSSIADGREPWSCYRGVFMENNTPFSTLNPGEHAIQRVRDPTDLLSPCLTVGKEYQHACFHFLPLNQRLTFAERGVTDMGEQRALRIEACYAVADASLRDACFEGVALSLFFYERATPGSARDACVSLRDEREEAACMFGFAHLLVSFGRLPEAMQFCRSAERNVQRACYQAVFDSIQNLGVMPVENACDGSDNPSCSEVLAAFRNNPQDMVFMWK